MQAPGFDEVNREAQSEGEMPAEMRETAGAQSSGPPLRARARRRRSVEANSVVAEDSAQLHHRVSSLSASEAEVAAKVEAEPDIV